MPEPVNGHDFIDLKLGRTVPYGVYDITNIVGWVTALTLRANDDETSTPRKFTLEVVR